jgi:hypothetical protein
VARFECRCGTVLSNSLVPNDVELRVYTDKEWDEYMIGDVIDPVMIPRPKFDVWKCSVCGRVHVFEGEILIRTYSVEFDRTRETDGDKIN